MTQKLSEKLFHIACYYLGLFKKKGNPINVKESQGLAHLNHVIYFAYGYHLASQGIKLFDDPIVALSSGPSMIIPEQAEDLIPFVDVTFGEMKNFPLDLGAYVNYLWEPFENIKIKDESLEEFMKRAEKKELELNPVKLEELRHEMQFLMYLKQIHSGELTSLPSNIEFWFNTPNHPFEKYLENLYSTIKS